MAARRVTTARARWGSSAGRRSCSRAPGRVAASPREAGRQEGASAGARVPGPAGRPGEGRAPPRWSEPRWPLCRRASRVRPAAPARAGDSNGRSAAAGARGAAGTSRAGAQTAGLAGGMARRREPLPGAGRVSGRERRFCPDSVRGVGLAEWEGASGEGPLAGRLGRSAREAWTGTRTTVDRLERCAVNSASTC